MARMLEFLPPQPACSAPFLGGRLQREASSHSIPGAAYRRENTADGSTDGGWMRCRQRPDRAGIAGVSERVLGEKTLRTRDLGGNADTVACGKAVAEAIG